MLRPVKILTDWGGTIIRDADLFKQIADKSNNKHCQWESPESWEKIQVIGNENYFKEIKEKFFLMGECYPDAISMISTFCGDNDESDSQIFIAFDNKPDLKDSYENTLRNLAFAFYKRGGDVNGFYVDTDKVIIAKQNQIDIVVEDDPRIAVSLALSGIKVILMLRRWNAAFNLDTLRLTTRNDKYNIIASNLSFVEDWYDAGTTLGRMVDQIRSEM